MSIRDERDPAAPEPDPTGVRALLAALPDPGPMPVEVSQRITASLQQAQEQRQQPVSSRMPPASKQTLRARVTRTPTVSSLDHRRHSRAPHVLAAAASVAAVALAGVVVLDQVAGDGSLGDTAAVYGGGDDSGGADSADGGAEQAESGPEQDTSAGAAADGSDSSMVTDEGGKPSGQLSREQSTETQAGPASEGQFEGSPGNVRVISVPEPMNTATFAVGVSSALQSAGTDLPDEPVTTDSGDLSPATVQPCLMVAGEEAAAQAWIVSTIELDGDDAVLVVAAGDPSRAWALAPGCVLGEDTDILLGPVDVP